MSKTGGGTGVPTKTIYVKETGCAEVYRLCELPYWQIEEIADVVVRKLGGMVSGCGYWDSESRICSLYRPTAKSRYCDRNICMTNEYNGIECDECEVTKHNERIKKCESCYIAQNHNLEDDDSPCQNCGVE